MLRPNYLTLFRPIHPAQQSNRFSRLLPRAATPAERLTSAWPPQLSPIRIMQPTKQGHSVSSHRHDMRPWPSPCRDYNSLTYTSQRPASPIAGPHPRSVVCFADQKIKPATLRFLPYRLSSLHGRVSAPAPHANPYCSRHNITPD